jgi:penicillin-binding protein 1A
VFFGLAQETAYEITHMMKGVVERGTGQAAKVLGRPIAAKTGTTNDYSNAWFIGFTPRVATGVWVGYDRPRSLGRDETGSRVAVPIWVTYMGKVLAGSPKEDFRVPEGVVFAAVDLDASNECVRVVPMAFVKGTEPSVACGPRRQNIVPGMPGAIPDGAQSGPFVPPATSVAPTPSPPEIPAPSSASPALPPRSATDLPPLMPPAGFFSGPRLRGGPGQSP